MRRPAIVVTAVLFASAPTVPAAAAAQSAPTVPAVAAAQSAPAGPVVALGAQLVPGRGVSIVESAQVVGGVLYKVRGRFAFGKGRVAASEWTETVVDAGRRRDLGRFRNVGGIEYASGGGWAKKLPEGKTWVRMDDPPSPPERASYRPLNVFEPATLRKVLATTAAKTPGGVVGGARTVLHKGSITTGSLYAVSPSFRELFAERPSARAARVEVRWRLWLDTENLPRRLTTSWVLPADLEDSLHGGLITDTRFSGWGSPSVIKAPPAGDRVDHADLG
ncbi:hypothetical protein ACFOWE_10470 [Planomonospora corallina]|uniref:Uncharacterized protein n=1 Tax=Planomonospora corallina TaxID=1806052 RepID=A0ABV8I6T6_9ACTN